MANQSLRVEVDIRVFPKCDKTHLNDKTAEFTIGDMHGSALKLLFFLTRQNVLKLSKDDYATITEIFLRGENVDRITAADLAKFKEILARTKVDRNGKVRLLGDLLADRGANDYFTLKIIEKLFDAKVSLEILLSNHDADFIKAYESKPDFNLHFLEEGHAGSMARLQKLIDKKLVTRDEILAIANRCYKKTLKPVSYAIDPKTNKITLFSHAGIGLNSIAAMARKFGIDYQDSCVYGLGATIDRINAVFQTYADHNTIHTLLNQDAIFNGYLGLSIDPVLYPFEHAIWNRRYDNLMRPLVHNGYQIDFGYGHDSNDIPRPNIIILDNNLAKGCGDGYTGEYHILYSGLLRLNLFHRVNNLFRAPSTQPQLSGVVSGAIISGIAAVSIAWMVSIGLVGAVAIAMGLRLRNSFYQNRLNAIKEDRIVIDQPAYQYGKVIAKSNYEYAKSFLDIKAWKKYRTIGAGMVDQLQTDLAARAYHNKMR